MKKVITSIADLKYLFSQPEAEKRMAKERAMTVQPVLAILAVASLMLGIPAQATLMISDNFNTVTDDDTRLVDQVDLAARQSGSLATVNWGNARYFHYIRGDRLRCEKNAWITGRFF